MSVLVVTSLGDIVVDLFTELCPLTSKNFLKLCKMKYYNGCLFHTVQKDFTVQTGDPSGTGTGGDSVYKFLYGDQARFFSDEIHLDLKHTKIGTIAMASAGENLNSSQFYITLRDELDYLDGKHTVFGEVAEGFETLTRINEAYVDTNNRPYKNIRVKHTYVLDDPFEDPPQLAELIPDASPEGKPKEEVIDEVRLEDDWIPLDEKLGPVEFDETLRTVEAHTRAVVLETIGDIPDAEIKPPENVLFVCKLNPVTEDDDLFTIFSRFGTVVSADIIRDYKTGDSLCYAFIEFEDKDACERAYFKMDNTLIDDRRIHVDFSQSVSKLWNQYRRKNSNGGRGGGGCFKCGAADHISKDCDKGVKSEPVKYILKEDNTQRGGAHNSRYEMVFDEELGRDDTGRRRKRDDRSPERRYFRDDVDRRKDRVGDRRKHEPERYDRDKRKHDDYDRNRKMNEGERFDRDRRKLDDDRYNRDKRKNDDGKRKYESRDHQRRHDDSRSSTGKNR